MKRVLLIFTGGTIAMVRDPLAGVLTPPKKPTQLLEALPQLQRLAEIDIAMVSNIDSSDLQPELWHAIAETIHDNQHAYDGFVVTHGTDTLAYTTAALSLVLNATKPVVCTGSQRPLVGELVSDATLNLAHAVEAATLDIGEVCLAFGSRLLRGSRTHKQSEFHFEAFTSFGTPPLAEFGVRCQLLGNHRQRRGEVMTLRSTVMDRRVAWMPVYPGMDPGHLSALVEQGVRGLYLQGYGAGNVPTLTRSLIPAIRAATNAGVTVAIGTQCSFGGVESLYATGQAALDAGAVSAGDMTAEMTIVKLMWALGQSDQPDVVRRILETPYAQERSEDFGIQSASIL